ncbi:hypothetical protein [Brevibacterium sandarakinum]|uniref:hypothetical protein n=1 Tax=Brevibacterium sandarakinum TaxID=629680 RepID=UPI002655DE5E|nr:hypothetical protein [Brevibacterium sandarakinum]MDN5658310.1 hypothetical protein [Brevibacterium sandarakinum]
MKVILVSELSDRLAAAKNKLGISTRKMSELAQASGYRLSNYSATVYTNGSHPATADPATLEALAFVLRLPSNEVRRLAGIAPDLGDFEPDESANLLTRSQRSAVNEIIRQLAVANTKAGEGNADSPTPISNGNKPLAVDENDAAGDNVYSLVPPPPATDTAAYRAPNRGKKQKDEADKRGEEDQDTAGDDGSQDPEDRE